MTNPHVLKAQFLDIIKNQIQDGDPPETKQTYDRLIAEGHSHEETMKMLACIVAGEIVRVVKHNTPYDEASYVAALKDLPQLPVDD